MVEAMKSVAQMDSELSVEERNLLSVGYKNVIGSRRASWRIIKSIEEKEASKGEDCNQDRVKNMCSYREKIEKELDDICKEVLEVLDKHIIPNAQNAESQVFFNKM